MKKEKITKRGFNFLKIHRDTAVAAQGTVVAYESASGGILDTLSDMQEKAEESLSSTRKDEMEAALRTRMNNIE